MVWFTANKENVESYTNILGLSVLYMVHLNQLKIRRRKIVFPICLFMISTTIFFPSFITQGFGSLKMWAFIHTGVISLMFRMVDGKPIQMEDRRKPFVYFTRKFKIFFLKPPSQP